MEKIKRLIDLLKAKISKINFKEFWKSKFNILMIISTIIIIVIIILMAFLVKRHKEYKLHEIYKAYPSIVRKAYANIVDVSCSGDLHFNVELDGKERDVKDLEYDTLMAYLFSYMEKNNQLASKVNISLFKQAESKLFNGDLKLMDKFITYEYGDYVYTLKDDLVTRESKECVPKDMYVTYLYGYAWKEDTLSIDVNVGYFKEDYLYDLSDNKLGSYDWNKSKLPDIMSDTSYYRLKYQKVDGTYKLSSVKLMSRS